MTLRNDRQAYLALAKQVADEEAHSLYRSALVKKLEDDKLTFMERLELQVTCDELVRVWADYEN